MCSAAEVAAVHREAIKGDEGVAVLNQENMVPANEEDRSENEEEAVCGSVSL